MTSDKTALRAQLRSLRRKLAAEAPDAGQRAAALWPGRPGAGTFALYHPAGSEIDPTPLRARVPAGSVCLPVAQSRQGALIFRRHMTGEALVPDALGIPAPDVNAAVLPDVVFAPLLAFDRRGGRLGQGGGHYDRTLANLRRMKAIFVIGLAYAGQERPEIPMEPHDQRLDAILTETEYVEFG
ncbi:5-formyltetrahydrofolate cyclo-ligase [Phenylobacterium sp.]|uniref:5-formyltetrahydrofolate cyclo-ligase n=1 Tax=Phenylobacterium sp. TaxID=1871053 RepID=UPI003D290043